MSFIYLNNKSAYSFLSSTLKVKDLVKIGIENKMPFLALTDLNNMFGVAEFIEECKKNNIKPIIGMEVKLNNLQESPLVLLASSFEGYKSLCKLTSIVSVGDLNYNVSLDELRTCKEGIICILPYIRSGIYDLEYDSQLEFINDIRSVYTGFYLGLEYYGPSDTYKLDKARKLADNNLIRTVPLFEVLTDSKKNVELLDVLRAIKNNTPVSRLEEVNYNNKYFMSDFDISQIYKEKEFNSAYFLAQLCNIEFDKIKGEMIKYPLDKDIDHFEYLKSLCITGIKIRLNNNVPAKYYQRIDYELGIIKKMGYVDYFLVVFDYVKYAKKNDIFVGQGRGSAGGSLISYCLGIINVDPLKYDLLFERFLNPERVSMPDIDTDFIDYKREQVIDYLSSKYGQESVARIVTFSTLKARSVIRDTAKALGCSLGEVDDIAKRLERVKDPDISLEQLKEISPSFKSVIETNEKYRQVYEVARRLEGLPRQSGIHASGVVINNYPLTNIIPVYKTGDGTLLTQNDMNHIETINLLKMDLLSISDLRIIDDCTKLVNKLYDVNLNINKIDYDDPNIYKIIQQSRTINIFQFDQPSMTRAGNIIKPKDFNEVVLTIALARPGPSQFIRTYCDRRDGKEKVSYIHPAMQEILGSTYGIIVYQEQIMQLLVKVAGFSMGKADLVRRAISKKDITKMAANKKDIIDGCLNNGISSQDAEKIYEYIAKFADYGFNKSHSVAYSCTIAQMCYLKYYYPEVFYAVSLNIYGDEKKLINSIEEMKQSNCKMLHPSINMSEVEFTVLNKNVLFGLGKIKNVNPKSAISIVEERNKNGKYQDYLDAVIRLRMIGLEESEILSLIQVGCFDEFKDYNRITMENNLSKVYLYADVITFVDENGNTWFDKDSQSKPMIDQFEQDNLEELEKEKILLGTYISSSPLDKFRKSFDQYGFVRIKDITEKSKKYKAIGLISRIEEVKTKNGDKMAFMTIKDETSSIDVVVFQDKYDFYKGILQKNKYIQIVGFSQFRDDRIQLVLDKAKTFTIEEMKA